MNKYCKLTLRCFLALFLISSSFSCTPSVAPKTNQDQGSENTEKIENFTAKDFIGVMTGEEIYVLNSDLSWDAYKEAAYYNVFIDGEKTNDSKITETKFQTAYDGDVDVDAKMGDSPKDIKIEVKAYSSDDSELASASVIKKIPAKPKFSILEINGKKFQENIEVENPVSIKLKVNNAIKFWPNDNNEKDKNNALINLNSYIRFEAKGKEFASTYSYDEKNGCITVEPLGALSGNDKSAKDYQLKIKAQFSDKYKLWYTNADKIFNFKIARTNSAANPLKVEKILLNDDESKNLMTNSLENVNVKSTVSIIFNQLIDMSSYGVSNTDTKGSGIYITTRETGKGDDKSRLTNAQYEKINDNGIWKTKITFTMAGETYYSSEPDPLKGHTKYYIVIEDDTIKSGHNTKISNEIRKSFTTGEGIEKLHSLSVQGGRIKGYTEKDIKLTEGTEFTIIADDSQNGKSFVGWYVGEYYKPELTETQKKSKELTLKMRAYDTTFSAEYK